ncbi:MAG: BatD family protein [Desulfopila sp.]|jgi:hypothetical protein|nr:BatD family protein [Desulfopila sp.]
MITRKTGWNYSTAMMLVVILVFLVAAVLRVNQAAARDNLTLSATLNTTSFSLHDTAVLTITVNGARSADITLPEVEHLLFHQSGQSVRTSIINGSSSSSITSTFILQPQQEGEYTLPPCTVEVNGETLTTEPLSFTVTAAERHHEGSPDGKGDGRNEIDNLAFVTISGLKSSIYTGEVLPVEIKAYFRRGIRVEIPKLPEIKGDAFVLSPPVDPPQQMAESYEGEDYSTISWKSAVSAVKDGRHNLRIQLDATLLVPQRPTRTMPNRHPLFRDDFFNDDFFDGFFNSISRKEVSLSTPEHTFIVQPLPAEGQPAHFSGAIGSFNFSATANQDEIEAGEPVTLVMTISGTGNFDRVSAPSFPEGKEWKTYTPTATFSKGSKEPEGKKVFEQALVAESTEVTEIPSLSFSYFDPEKKKYITRTTSPLPLTVNTSSQEQEKQQRSPVTGQQERIAEERVAPLPLHTHLEIGRHATISPVFHRSWYIAAWIFCTVILIGALGIFLRNRHRRRHSKEVQHRLVLRDIAEKRKGLRQAVMDNNVDEFLQGCRSVIQMHWAFLWQKEPSAITLADLQKRLPPDSPFIHIFSTAEKFRYGGPPPTNEEMRTFLDTLEKELEVRR